MRRRGRRESGFSFDRKHAEILGFQPFGPGQHYPQRCPRPEGSPSADLREPLGPPLSVNEAARLIGCSAWTVRQTLVPMGLPVFRSGPGGKLFFYKTQIIRWIETQQKGGTR